MKNIFALTLITLLVVLCGCDSQEQTLKSKGRKVHSVEWYGGDELSEVSLELDGQLLGRGAEGFQSLLEHMETFPIGSRISFITERKEFQAMRERGYHLDVLPIGGEDDAYQKFSEICVRRNFSTTLDVTDDLREPIE